MSAGVSASAMPLDSPRPWWGAMFNRRVERRCAVRCEVAAGGLRAAILSIPGTKPCLVARDADGSNALRSEIGERLWTAVRATDIGAGFVAAGGIAPVGARLDVEPQEVTAVLSDRYWVAIARGYSSALAVRLTSGVEVKEIRMAETSGTDAKLLLDQ